MQSTTRDAKQIFSDAIERYSPEQWTAYLDGACGEDDVLRDRVERLLKAHGRADSFLDAEPATIGLSVGEKIGTSVGPYKLLQMIGEGGFGVVYMAEQSKPVRRKLALKVIKPGMDTKEVIARFEAERQALALMDHPNIAKVLDVGTTGSGLPYLAMELVKGVKITEYADINHLSTDDRLRLFASVCRAVQHAHQKGVIHRDLKPSNVMVTLHDGKPVVKVIDFGVAKAVSQPLTERTLFTRYGQVIGTPQYMSPEQAEMSGLDVDTRSDVYSLGVILYELLTGRTPFTSEQIRSAGYDEMRRMIREDQPAKPSNLLQTFDAETATSVASNRGAKPDALRKLVRGELDWIVMRTLDKDRNRRYDTASGLADDVDRYLNDEPVNASPPSLTYSLAKAFRRHRAACLTASTIAVALVGGLCVSLAAMRQSELSAAVADRERIRAEEANAQAELERRRAQKLADQAARQARTSEQTLELVMGLLSRSGRNPATGMDYTVQEALAALAASPTELSPARSSSETPGQASGGSLSARLPLRVRTVVHSSIGDAYLRSGVDDRAIAHYQSSVAAYRELGNTDSLQYAAVLRNLGMARRVQEDIRTAIAIERKRNASHALSASMTCLAALLLESDSGGHEEARALLEEACKRFQPRPDIQLNEIPFMHLSRLHRVVGNIEAAAHYERLAIENAVQSHWSDQNKWKQLGKSLREQKKYFDSNYALLVADSMWPPKSGDEPAYYLGLNALDAQEWELATKYFRRSLKLARGRSDKSRSEAGMEYLFKVALRSADIQTVTDLIRDSEMGLDALTHNTLSRWRIRAQTEPELRSALASLRAILATKVDQGDVDVHTRSLLAHFEFIDGNWDRTAELLDGESSMTMNLGPDMYWLGQLDESARIYRQQTEYCKKHGELGDAAWSLKELASLHYLTEDLSESEKYLREALATSKSIAASPPGIQHWLETDLALVLYSQGKELEAQKLFADANAGIVSRKGSDPLWGRSTDLILECLSKMLSGQSYSDDVMLENIQTLASLDLEPIERNWQHALAAILADKQGRPDKAIEQYELASLILPKQYRFLPRAFRLNRLMTLYQETGQLPRGREHFAKLVASMDVGISDRQPLRASYRVRLAKLILADESADRREAATLLREATEIYSLHKIAPQRLFDEIDALLTTATDASEEL